MRQRVEDDPLVRTLIIGLARFGCSHQPDDGSSAPLRLPLLAVKPE